MHQKWLVQGTAIKDLSTKIGTIIHGLIKLKRNALVGMREMVCNLLFVASCGFARCCFFQRTVSKVTFLVMDRQLTEQ